MGGCVYSGTFFRATDVLVRSTGGFKLRKWLLALGLVAFGGPWWAYAAERVDVAPLVESLRTVGRFGEGHRAAAAAWPRLAEADAEQLPEILAGMQGADLLACNWIRSAVETIVQRHLQQGGALPIPALEQFLADSRQAPRARRLAYELLTRVDAEASGRLLDGLLDDPSPELRYDAVARALQEAAELIATDRAAALQAYQRALRSAREVQQVRGAASKIRELGGEVDLSRHFGFLLRWTVVGPFDNTGGAGLEAVYPPEQEVNLNAIYAGKLGEVRWQEVKAVDEFGLVDLNEVFGRPKPPKGSGYADTPELLPRFRGVVAYAYSDFWAETPCEVELRLGCINAHKVWLNGDLVISNRVYHTGMTIDQYVGQGRLQAGRNTILVKVAQNEQTQDWAQQWQFQLRVCDQYGTAVLAADREE